MTVGLLHAVFGPAPSPSGDWLDVPTSLLAAYTAMLPTVEAQRQLRAIQAAQLGSGSVKKQVASQRVRELSRQAKLPGKARPASEASIVAAGGRVAKAPRPSWHRRVADG